MNKKIVFTILGFLVAAAGIYFILQRNKAKNEAEVAIVAETNTDVAVRAASVTREDISGEFNVNGTFQPNKQANISAEMGGQVVNLYVREGSYVRAGQTIARLAGDKINVNVTNARANLDAAEATLARYEAAYQTGGITALQLDQARLQVKNARAQVQSANLTSGDTQVRSKVSGIVNQKMIEVGTVVAPGTPIVEVVDISSLKLRVEVDEGLVGQLALGNTVNIVPSTTGDTLSGKISFIAPASTGALKFPVEITMANPGNKLRAGMYATAVFNRAGVNNVLTVPREAFVGSVSDNQVFVVRDSVAYLTRVQSGVNYGDKVQVLAGLQEGESVVTSGHINLKDKTKVRILK